MKLWALSAIVWLASGASTGVAAGPLGDLVREVRSADYRGARGELRQLAGALGEIKDPKLAAYRDYWRGFAQWRRALNGFNETPFPADLEDDLKAGLASFRAALGEKPDWIEARIGMVGCASGLLFLAKGDAERTQAILSDYTPVAREMRDKGTDNPRALWLTGGAQLGAPPPYGGDVAKAAATFRRGIEAALAEARQLETDEPTWVPRWGAAENLMNLAYLYTHTPLANRELARAYAEGALVAAPEWHYVRDILWPQIEALAPPPAVAASGPTP